MSSHWTQIRILSYYIWQTFTVWQQAIDNYYIITVFQPLVHQHYCNFITYNFIIFPWECHRGYHQKSYSNQELPHFLLLLLLSMSVTLGKKKKKEIRLVCHCLLLANPYSLSYHLIILQVLSNYLINCSNNFWVFNLYWLLYNSLDSSSLCIDTISSVFFPSPLHFQEFLIVWH